MSLLDATIAKIAPLNSVRVEEARSRLENLAMPHWSLGMLMDTALDLAGITDSLKPALQRKVIAILVGDHGVAAEGVSKFPREVTAQTVHNIVQGGAVVCALARRTGARLVVVDMGVAANLDDLAEEGRIISKSCGKGTANMLLGPAMDRATAQRSVEAGIELALELGAQADLLGIGDMGIGSTTSSAAVIATLTGHPVSEIAGRGTGMDDKQLRHKIQILERSLQVNSPNGGDPLDTLAKVGGFELGGIAGFILGAAALRKPVVFDSFVTTAGALLAHKFCELSVQYLISAHQSLEKGHHLALKFLGKDPLLRINSHLGMGSGCVLALGLIDSAACLLSEVATFEEANIHRAKA